MDHFELNRSADNTPRPAEVPLPAPPLGISPPAAAPSNGAMRIGAPMVLSHGQFAGRTIRVALSEIQQADVGRKLSRAASNARRARYSRKDRRPLDPPPIVHCRIFRVTGVNAEVAEDGEEELDYVDVRPEGMVCQVDLFMALQSRVAKSAASNTDDPPQSATANTSPDTTELKVTEQLAGSTFVQLHSIKLHGKPALVFAFTDISVRAEGVFWLRYRCFDLFSSIANPATHPVLAECAGGRFRVYSTKDFPGLAASTELTQHIAVMGIRTNNRTTERKRRREETEQGENADDAI